MKQVAAGRHVAAVVAAATLLLGPGNARAQEAAPAEVPDVPLDTPLDPSAPLDPMPEIDLPWPDLEADSGAAIADAPDTSIAEAAAERSYRVRFEGLDGLTGEDLLAQFRSLSTLEANRKDAANAAQIDRRAREDADLLAELLRSRGYYDALVRTRVEAAAGTSVDVVLEAEPGPLYRFADVALPGVEAAGRDETALRGAFGVEEGQPVDAAAVIGGEAALRTQLGERGYALAEVGEPEVVVDHETRTATLSVPVQPDGARRFGSILVEGTPLFSARHIGVIARFDEGDPYRVSEVEDLRRALINTGIVSSVDLRPVPREGSDLVDVAVALEPPPPCASARACGWRRAGSIATCCRPRAR